MAGSRGPRVLVCRSVGRCIRPVRRLSSRCPGENRVRRESGVPDVTHRPLVPWPMASAIGQGTSWFVGLVYAVLMGTDGYDRKRIGSVQYGWVRLGWVRYGSSIVCVVLMQSEQHPVGGTWR